MSAQHGRTALVLGGARSGKSRVALQLGRATTGRRAFVATCRIDLADPEMAARIAAHRARRHPTWTTIEEPLELGERVETLSREYDVIVVDCLTLWLANLLDQDGHDEPMRRHIERLTTVVAAARARIILVSNEVGLGVVPPTRVGRIFRDWQGLVNQAVAEAVDDVYAVTAGLPRRLKPMEVA